ncbi:MAG TPA: polyribonucleotide nucleotidyltransferase, partial [Syntrophorhabdaceae bacterium]|nr:polyribonucleotide nucleotidyltransferase [Syntrophorhabdaceae bacterium]
MEEKISIEFAGRPLSISTGDLAKQADGSVIARYGDTVVLVTVVAEKLARDKDFLPLTVNYQEMSFAAGKFPGGFFKREGRPTTREILTSRLIDRPLRPLFPKGWRFETQVISTVLSADQDNDPAALSLLGASCAVHVSDIPFEGPFAGVRVGRIDGVFVANPTFPQMVDSDIDIVVTGTRDAIIMVEGEAHFVKGVDLIEAIEFGHQAMMPLIEIQEQLRERIGKAKRQVQLSEDLEEKKKEVRAAVEKDLIQSFEIKAKLERYARQDQILKDLQERYSEEEMPSVAKAYEDVTSNLMR